MIGDMMNDKIVSLNIDSFTNTKSQMDDKYNELVKIVSKFKEMIEDSKNIYDTDSASIYRTIALAYSNLVEKYLNNEVKPYIDSLDKIKNVYLDELNALISSLEEKP
jgi:hypothetical protein